MGSSRLSLVGALSFIGLGLLGPGNRIEGAPAPGVQTPTAGAYVPAPRKADPSVFLVGCSSDTVSYGYYTEIGGTKYAVLGETWTFDHGGLDPFEGWCSRDLSIAPDSAAFQLITAANWSGHGNTVPAPIISGSTSTWIGLHEDEANARGWAGGLGYGNDWCMRWTSPLLPVRGSGDQNLSFTYFNDTGPVSDVTRLSALLPDGSRIPLNGSGYTGRIGNPATSDYARERIVIPHASFAGESQFRLEFEMTSDGRWSDEDGGWTTAYGPFAYDDVLVIAPSDWTVEGNQTGAQTGFSVSGAGDVNNDGHADVIVSMYRYDGDLVDEGRAIIYHGSAAGLSTAPSWTVEGNQTGALFGVSVSTAGDVNNDGFDDVIVGAHRYDNGHSDEGGAWVYHGSATGVSTTPSWSGEGGQTLAFYGKSVSTAGDVNNDGYDDVIVGAFWFDNGQTDEGKAYLYKGSSTGVLTAAIWTAEGGQIGSRYGSAVSTAGDVNGDGRADVIVGAPHYDNVQTDEGAVYVYHGTPTGLSFTPAWVREGNQDVAAFGSAVAAAGDVNGDGYDDVLVGAPYHGNGQSGEGSVYLYPGSPAGLSTTPAWVWESNQTEANAGTSVAGAGDVNGDGYADVIIGAPTEDNPEIDEGMVHLFLGSSTWPSSTPDWSGESDQVGANLGIAVSTVSDVSGSGFAGFLAGASTYDNGQDGEGRAYLWLSVPLGEAGWTGSLCEPVGSGLGVSPLSSYTIPDPPGYCGLSGNVLEFHDSAQAHPVGQREIAISPLVDLATSGIAPPYIILAELELYADMPRANGVFFRPGWHYSTVGCDEGWGGRVGRGWISTGSEPVCFTYRDVATDVGVPSDVDQVGFALEIYASCDAFGIPSWECTHVTNFSPIIDNIRIRVTQASGTGSISGRVFDDQTGNCLVSGIQLSGRYVMLEPVGHIATTNSSGFYSFADVCPGNYTIRLLPKPSWEQTCPPDPGVYNVTVSSGSVITGRDFASSAIPGIQDMVVRLAASRAKVGFSTAYSLSYRNAGTVNVTATATLRLPASVQYVSSYPAGVYSAVNHSVVWTLGSLPPDVGAFISVGGIVDATVPIGAELYSVADIAPLDGDATPSDNATSTIQIAVGSFDPNEKAVTPEGGVGVGQTLSYQVDFQNFGTAEATNIAVRDTLRNEIDITTLTMGASSHSAEFEIDGRVVTWTFLNINLPPAIEDEAGSQGFVTFTVRPLANLVTGTEIENRGAITFDFNVPVLTNTVTNFIIDPSDVPPWSGPAPRIFALERIWPSPSAGPTTLRFAVPARGWVRAELYDSSGRRVDTIVDGPVEPGLSVFGWDGRNEDGDAVVAGVYFVRAELARPGFATRRVVSRLVRVE